VGQARQERKEKSAARMADESIQTDFSTSSRQVGTPVEMTNDVFYKAMLKPRTKGAPSGDSAQLRYILFGCLSGDYLINPPLPSLRDETLGAYARSQGPHCGDFASGAK